MTHRALLLSVRPHFAARILDGSKTIELRRVRPRVAPGDRVLVYVSSPVMALVVRASVASIVEADPAALWAQVRAGAGVSRAEYNAYFRGAARGVGIRLRDVAPLARAIPLAELRASSPGFHPPQTHRYVDARVFGIGREKVVRAALASSPQVQLKGAPLLGHLEVPNLA